MKNPFTLACHVLLFATLSACLFSEDGGRGSELDAILGHFADEGLFSGVVRVDQDGEALFERAFGMASEELGVPSDPRFRYKLHSATKPILAVAVMRTVEEGRVELDGSICQWLQPCPRSWSRVTLRHLLRHTSGIPDFTYLLLEQWQEDIGSTLTHLADDLPEVDPAAEPGETWSYSNAGYVLAARILETVHVRPIHAVLDEHVFRPAGMTGATLERAPNPDWPFDGSLVEDFVVPGYNGTPDTLQVAYSKMYVIPGAGGVVAGAEDISRFLHAVFRDDLLAPASREEMLAVPDAQDAVPYALGWVQTEVDGQRAYRHDGGNNGFTTYFEYVEESGVALILLSNRGFTPLGPMLEELRPAVRSLAGQVRRRGANRW